MKKFITILLLMLCLDVFSQDDPADGDAQVPIDGGITLLLASGAIYGLNKIRTNKITSK
jgi:hypothetical protein